MEKSLQQSWRTTLHETIYESNTTAGKIFDVALLVFILGSIIIVMLDSIESYHRRYGESLFCTGMDFHHSVQH